ncbi:MAG: hypothetical protein IJ168_06395 [Eubacterium sp.]|nr:hypothetical protein [Eubacterium sp.]
MSKKNKNNQNNNINIESDGTKRIIDLRRFLEHDMSRPDPTGAYTDMPQAYYETGQPEAPEQDADDL